MGDNERGPIIGFLRARNSHADTSEKGRQPQKLSQECHTDNLVFYAFFFKNVLHFE